MSLLLALQGANPPMPEWAPERDLPVDDKLVIPADAFASGVVVPVTDPRVIEYFMKNPDELRRMHDRLFEEFIAELMKKFGYDVRIGPRGKDGGVDVTAERHPLAPELVLIQCKRYGAENKVGVSVVKQLYADVEHRRATSGLVVTTSTFTPPALKFIESVKYRLAGHDLERLKAWLKAAHESIAGGPR